MTVTYHRETHHSKCSKCLLLALRHAIKQARHWSIDWLMKLCWFIFNQMPFQLMDIPRWFLINMFLRFSFSRWLQALVHWCGFHAARSESEWCIGLLLRCLAAQTVAVIHLSSCWRLLLFSAPCVRKSTELLWHKTPDFAPDMPHPNRPDLNPVDYGIWTVIQECIYQKQQGSSYITGKLWLLTEWHITFHKVG